MRHDQPHRRVLSTRAARTAPLLVALAGCTAADGGAAPAHGAATGLQIRPRGLRPGGDTTVALGPIPSFVLPAANLGPDRKPEYYAGKALATQPWVRAPTTTDARDGLGPLYHARACMACHVKGGRGEAADTDGLAPATLVRLSVPGRGPHGEPVPDPVYGAQLQPKSTSLSHQLRGRAGADAYQEEGAPPEADVRVRWTPSSFEYPDGTVVELRSPTLEVSSLGYGPMDPQVRLGLRHTPSLAGMGLLEAIDAAELERLADPDDRDGNGVSGRLNWVWDPESNAMRPGRFGLKANQPSLRVQVAGALSGDMGLSSPVFPDQPCTVKQQRCLAAPNGNDADGFEVPDSLLASMTAFVASTAVPERRRPDDPVVLRGQSLFDQAGCADCHVPHHVTVANAALPHLSSQEIWPYTDLLLHDMGPDLADGREDFEASGAEWRTPPLWGAGLARAMQARVGFLHDGRARTIEEAVLWHGAEARASRDRFAELSRDDRRALLAFVRSL